MWVMTWGTDTPRDLPQREIAGLQQRDMGEWPVADSLGTPIQAYREHFKWEIGFAQRDGATWPHRQRRRHSTHRRLRGELINLLVRALYRLPTAPVSATTVQTSDTPAVRPTWAVPHLLHRIIRTYLDLQAMNKTNVLLRN